VEHGESFEKRWIQKITENPNRVLFEEMALQLSEIGK
jgi:hypothetical protein